MSELKIKHQLVVNTMTFAGLFCFVGLYIYAASLYPGGSQVNIHSSGFDWLNNYWCNLMNEKGMNGEPNQARSISIIATVLLCASIGIFFYQFARFFAQKRIWKVSIKYGGLLSMSTAVFIFTPFHDLLTFISSIFGLFALIGIIVEIYNSQLRWYKLLGMSCIVLLIANNYIYYTTQGIEWLPLLQKVTFLLILIWIWGLNGIIRNYIKLDQYSK